MADLIARNSSRDRRKPSRNKLYNPSPKLQSFSQKSLENSYNQNNYSLKEYENMDKLNLKESTEDKLENFNDYLNQNSEMEVKNSNQSKRSDYQYIYQVQNKEKLKNKQRISNDLYNNSNKPSISNASDLLANRENIGQITNIRKQSNSDQMFFKNQSNDRSINKMCYKMKVSDLKISDEGS